MKPESWLRDEPSTDLCICLSTHIIERLICVRHDINWYIKLLFVWVGRATHWSFSYKLQWLRTPFCLKPGSSYARSAYSLPQMSLKLFENIWLWRLAKLQFYAVIRHIHETFRVFPALISWRFHVAFYFPIVWSVVTESTPHRVQLLRFAASCTSWRFTEMFNHEYVWPWVARDTR